MFEKVKLFRLDSFSQNANLSYYLQKRKSLFSLDELIANSPEIMQTQHIPINGSSFNGAKDLICFFKEEV